MDELLLRRAQNGDPEAFGQLMRELTGRAHGHPPHKLGLRTPHPAAAYSRAIQAYLWAKGLFMP